MSLHTLRGMSDILPDEIPLWREIEEGARGFFSLYGYQEIRTPVLEEMSVFTRSVGETTNIVEKEMYAFQDRNDKWVALRPEGTASIVRAYVEHNLSHEDPVARLFYLGPMYRHERPQKGRLRQFHQIGVEVFGIASPRLDAEVISMLDHFLSSLKIGGLETEINSLGCPICRPKFQRAFLDFLFKNESKLCTDCRRRMERNPLRVLDCGQEGCQAATVEAPSIQDHLCDLCEKDFDTVLTLLGTLGCSYRVNPRIVRGLDYYLKTTFEITSPDLGAQNAIAGGGRYDGLIRLMGGPNVPGFGFAIGMERLVELLKQAKLRTPQETARRGVFVAALGEKALQESIRLAAALRAAGIRTDLDYESKSLKSQMRRADKVGVRFVCLLGDEELKKKVITIKDLTSGKQEEIPLATLIDHIKKIQ